MRQILEKVLYECRKEDLFVCPAHLFLVWQKNPEVFQIPPNPMRRPLSLQLSDVP